MVCVKKIIMAIRIVEKGIIECDKCKKEIAKIRASTKTFSVLKTEPFTEIICADCYGKAFFEINQ